jgi:hypothetical protein
MLSTYIAEVTVGSAPFPFFDPFSILVAVPLYTLHILVLGTLVVRGRKVTLASLFVGGIIFGLYEAYITKVIWDPYWEFGITVHVADVAVIQTIILILWYHNFFAFIIPLFVAETYLSSSRKIFQALPVRVRSWFGEGRLMRTILMLAIAFGMLQAASGHGPAISLVSVGVGGLLIFSLCHIFRSAANGTSYTIDELLPDKAQFRILLALLLVFYAIFTPLLLPENMPGLIGHVSVILMYVGAFLLLRSLLRANGEEVARAGIPHHIGHMIDLSEKRVLIFLAAYTATATIMGFVAVLAGLVTICIHIAGVTLGVIILSRAVQSCIRLN